MGGHTISPDGIVLNMLPFNHMELNLATETLQNTVRNDATPLMLVVG
jgi:hypothetical protein